MARKIAGALAVFALATCALVPSDAASAPGEPPGQVVPATIYAGPASDAERRELIDALVAKWGPYVQAELAADVDAWRERMTARYFGADATNLREAVGRDTYEGAMAVLNGRGSRLSDADLVRLAAVAADDAGRSIRPLALGALGNDLVYTPIQPCRIIDTRSTAAGPIAAGTTRSFVAINASSFTGQGGSATNCGTLGLSATAVAITLQAVLPPENGYATIFPFGTAQPTASSINYRTGNTINNTVIAQIPNPLSSFDFTIYSLRTVHYVADIVGYFAPPLATALQCVETANTTKNVAANGTANAVAPPCPAGYTQTATNCETTSWLMPIVYFKDGTCSARNNGDSAADLKASRTCCRVPGR